MVERRSFHFEMPVVQVRAVGFMEGTDPRSETVQTRINNTHWPKTYHNNKTHPHPLKHKHNMHNVNKFTKTQKTSKIQNQIYCPIAWLIKHCQAAKGSQSSSSSVSRPWVERRSETKKRVALFSGVLCGFLQVVEGPILKGNCLMDHKP